MTFLSWGEKKKNIAFHGNAPEVSEGGEGPSPTYWRPFPINFDPKWAKNYIYILWDISTKINIQPFTMNSSRF